MSAWCVQQPVNSKTIRDAVEDELFMDIAVDSRQIDVLCNEGIVTLDGIVNNILAKERAERIAKTVKGVRAVVNKIRVLPAVSRSDSEIKVDVTKSLLLDPATDSYEIDVSVKNNAVTLTGKVQSWQERQLCEKVAKGVNGVTAVINNIGIEYKTARPDREIKKEIEKILKWDVLVDHALIGVKADDGKVTLSGVVGSAAEKSIAVNDAYIPGVKSVDSKDLMVKKWARDDDLRKSKYVAKSDQEIYGAVTDTLMYDPRVFSFNVTPEVSNAVVTLRGTVDNLKAKHSAAQDARNTVGVLAVKNRIKVRPESPVTDDKIKERVEHAIERNPYVESYDISVIATNRIVDLYGIVNSYFEKIQAGNVASRVNGVVAVDNNISVNDSYNSYYYSPYVDDSYADDEDGYGYLPRNAIKSDAKIKEDIENEFFWSPFVDSDDITISVKDGVATLTGKVNSSSEYYSATKNAYEGGATFVNNDLVISVQ
jgi:osmotically-inducible protein OsmY